ncbi:MAG TPA: hypothetical protein VK620_37570, partial [Bradyrhizobium sp.]|nr:hypothetical protein [Bradyrhizobium sp.]
MDLRAARHVWNTSPIGPSLVDVARMPRASRAWPIRVLMSSDVATACPGIGGSGQDSFLALRTCRPLYMPVFK